MARKDLDARLRRDDAKEMRGTAHVGEDAGRGADDGMASAEDRRRQLRNEWLYEALPRPPELPGFHFCWLSTTNQYDPIHKRMRLGYVPVKQEEIPDWGHLRVHSGEWAGCVSVNEMILFKIPSELYQEIMTEVHHRMPLEEEGRLRDNLREMQERTRDSSGRRLGRLEEGFERLGSESASEPIFPN